MKTLPVDPTFNARQLLPDLECYSLWPGQEIVVKGQDWTYEAFFDPGTNAITCSCDQFRQHGACEHQRALSGGLWPRLSERPEGHPIITCTRTWCSDAPATPVQEAAMHGTRR